MHCPQCGSETRPTDRFCGKCGNRLERVCVRCKAPLAEDDLFCRMCGTPAPFDENVRAVITEKLPPLDEPVEKTIDVEPKEQPAAAESSKNPQKLIVPISEEIVQPPPVITGVSTPPAPSAVPRAVPPPPSVKPPVPPGLVNAHLSKPRLDDAFPPVVYVYKGIFPRFLAAVLDGFILGLPPFLAAILILLAMGGMQNTDETTTMTVAGLLALAAAVIALIMEASGGTPGKRILGMRIINAGGAKPGLGRALVRNLLRLIDFLPAGYLLGVLLVVFHKRKQRLGDIVAGTFVVGRQ